VVAENKEIIGVSLCKIGFWAVPVIIIDESAGATVRTPVLAIVGLRPPVDDKPGVCTANEATPALEIVGFLGSTVVSTVMPAPAIREIIPLFVTVTLPVGADTAIPFPGKTCNTPVLLITGTDTVPPINIPVPWPRLVIAVEFITGF
jgi:hypothetical protein